MGYDVEFREISKEERDKADDSDFAGPHRSFPILKAADVEAALHSLGRAGNKADIPKIRARIIAIAKRKGFPLPKNEQEDEDKKMSVWTQTAINELDLDSFGSPDDRELPVQTQYDLEKAVAALVKYPSSKKDGVEKNLQRIAKEKGLVYPQGEIDQHQWGGPVSGPHANLSLGGQNLDRGGMYGTEDTVVRTGLIFKAGDYPDKGLTVTPEDLEKTVAQFDHPVDMEIEHIYSEGIRTFLDGRMGQLQSIWINGSSLFGELVVPRWIDTQWSDFGRKVSVVIDKVTHEIKRAGMVLDPRVEEAAVMSAYATFAANRHDTQSGQLHLQRMHDIAAHAGAVCRPPEGATMSDVPFVSNHELAGIQRMHDVSVEHGAYCDAQMANGQNQHKESDTMANVGSTAVPPRATAGVLIDSGYPRHYTGEPWHQFANSVQQTHELTSGEGGTPLTSVPTVSASTEKRTGMSTGFFGRKNMAGNGSRRKGIVDAFKVWYNAGPEGREAAREAGADLPPEDVFDVVHDEAVDASRDAALAAKDKAAKALEAEVAAMRDDREAAMRDRDQARKEAAQARSLRVQAEATGFVTGLIMNNKALPAQREAMIATYAQAAMDDAERPEVTFSASGQPGQSRVSMLQAMWTNQVPHRLTQEGIPTIPNGATVLLNQTKAVDNEGPQNLTDDSDQRKTLLQMSGLANGNKGGGMPGATSVYPSSNGRGGAH